MNHTCTARELRSILPSQALKSGDLAYSYGNRPKELQIDQRHIMERLQRMESRLIRGFGELGVRVCDDSEWFSVDVDQKIVHLKSNGKSLASIELAMRAAGCVVGDAYELRIGEEIVATMPLRPRR